MKWSITPTAYAAHYEIPKELVHAIITQESGWNPRAVSRKGRHGADAADAGYRCSVWRAKSLLIFQKISPAGFDTWPI